MERKSIKFTFPNEEMCLGFWNAVILSCENDLLEKNLTLAKEYVEKEYGSKYWLDSNEINYEVIKTKKKRGEQHPLY